MSTPEPPVGDSGWSWPSDGGGSGAGATPGPAAVPLSPLLPEDPPSAARARVLSVLAQLDIHGDDMPSAVRDAERAVAAALAAGETRSLADARVTLGAGTAYLGEAERGLEIMREGLAGAEGNAYTEVRGYANLADALGLMGRHEEAVEAATMVFGVAARSVTLFTVTV